MSAPVKIVLVYQSLLGIYGDRGNSLVLAKRLDWRGIASEVVQVEPGEPVPGDGAVYLLGGGEDNAQTTAVRELRRDGGLFAGLDAGGALFAVCAGYQICGNTFTIGEHDEVIEVLRVPFQRALEMVWQGELRDAKSALALLHAARHLGRLRTA